MSIPNIINYVRNKKIEIARIIYTRTPIKLVSVKCSISSSYIIIVIVKMIATLHVQIVNYYLMLKKL